MNEDVEDFLAHYGVKGMKWGQRRARRKEVKKEQKRLQDEAWGKRGKERRANAKEQKEILKGFKTRNAAAERAAANVDPQLFKRELKAYKKAGRLNSGGMSVKGHYMETTGPNGVFTGKLKGSFKDSQGNPVSVDFANAVMSKRTRDERVKNNIVNGLLFVTAAGATAAVSRR